MKVMILAAGRGERLRPLTDHTPKPLLKAGQYRLIEYLIHSLVAADFNEIIINYAHLGEQFPQLLDNGKQFGATIQYSAEQQGGLETAGGIIKALPLLGDKPFLVVNGDIATDYPFAQLRDITLKDSHLAHLVLVNNPKHHPAGDFALANHQISEKGSNRYTFSGIAIYHPRFFAKLEVQKLALKPLLLAAIAQKQLQGELYQGQWSDIGTIERLKQFESLVKLNSK